MLTRRDFQWASAGILLAGFTAPASATWADLPQLELAALGRLGVFVVDTATARSWSYRAEERFMMLSSFKLLASALVLQRVDAGLKT